MSPSSWTSPEGELSPGRLENQFYLNLRRKPRLRVGISFLLLYNKIPQNRDLNHISYLGSGGPVPQVLPRSSAQSLARLQSRCQLVQKSLVRKTSEVWGPIPGSCIIVRIQIFAAVRLRPSASYWLSTGDRLQFLQASYNSLPHGPLYGQFTRPLLLQAGRKVCLQAAEVETYVTKSSRESDIPAHLSYSVY